MGKKLLCHYFMWSITYFNVYFLYFIIYYMPPHLLSASPYVLYVSTYTLFIPPYTVVRNITKREMKFLSFFHLIDNIGYELIGKNKLKHYKDMINWFSIKLYVLYVLYVSTYTLFIPPYTVVRNFTKRAMKFMVIWGFKNQISEGTKK